MSRTSQRKGRDGELELVHLLHSYGFENVRPGKPISYGEEPDLLGLPGIHVESKRAEQIRLTEWMKQAERDSVKFHDGLPAVFHRRNRQEWLCTMRLCDFMEVYKRAILGGYGRSEAQEAK